MNLRNASNGLALAVVLAGSLCGPGAWAQVDERGSPPGAISGTVTLEGCRASDIEIRLKARPLVAVRGADGAIEPGSQRTVVTRAIPVGERTLGFLLDGLADGRYYRIGIKATPSASAEEAGARPCGRIAWHGLATSIGLAGGDALAITGSALRGGLEVLTDQPAPSPRSWARAGVFDFSPAGSQLPIRWRPPAGRTQGILQVATEPFGRAGEVARCVAPEGVVYQRVVDTAGLARQPDGSYLLPPLDLAEAIVPPPDTRIPGGEVIGPAPVDTVPTVSRGAFEEILLGKPLYARVLPVDTTSPDGTPDCDAGEHGLPPWVLILIADVLDDSAPPPPFDDLSVWQVGNYAGPVVYGRPNESYLCMRSTKPHELDNFTFGMDITVVGNTGYDFGDTFPANKRFCWPTNDDGGFDPIGTLTGIVSGLLSPIEWLANGVSSLWDEVKTYAINAVADGLNALHIIDCDDTCKSLLRTGLEIGLVAAGLPPSLPNFDELKQQGLDYVASQIASQTGLPTAVTEWAVNHGYDALAEEFGDQISAKRSSGLPLVDWAVWDWGIEPATLSLHLDRTQVGLLPSSLYIPGNAVYAPARVPIPRVFLDSNGQPGGTSLVLNISLLPNMSGWKSPDPVEWFNLTIPPSDQQVADSQKDYWRKQILANPCVPISVRRDVFVPGSYQWLPFESLLSFPSVPVLMADKPPHQEQLLVNGTSYCIAGGLQ